MDFAFLFADWLGKPAWMWLAFMGIVAALLALDLGVLHKENREIETKESLVLSAGYISLGLLFGAWVWWYLGPQSGVEYMTGFAIEKTLAMDNVFVIAMIFGYFAIPRLYQHRVLFWGILGVIVLRAIMIGIGAPIVENFSWVLYVFAVFLIFTGVKMLYMGDKQPDIAQNPALLWLKRRFNVTEQLHGEKFFVQLPDPKAPAGSGKLARFMTPLFLALILIEIADVIFAVDSVPAIFLITTDPFIVYTSNIFAILGLRALYFALAAMVHRFHYLKYALSILLIFIGSKIFVAWGLGWEKFPPVWGLGITVAILAAGIVFSLWKTRGDAAPARAG
ncbi:MAG: TerC family protein [Telmatospirillum sp.]|nr:TerC family protein [Telmatospirillum sp.]